MARPLAASDTVEGFKSATGELAESSPSLLGRTDATGSTSWSSSTTTPPRATPATSTDSPATSPRVTGVDLTGATAAEVSYESYTGEHRCAVPRRRRTGRSRRRRPASRSTRVYGGVAMQLPANQVDERCWRCRTSPPCRSTTLQAVARPTPARPSSAPRRSGARRAVRPSPARASSSATSTPACGRSTRRSPTPAARRRRPPKADGTPRACDFGDNPLTPAADVFVCNNKLIGGQPFIDTYNAILGGEVYPDSARDSNGHGTHTTSTAAGSIVDEHADLRRRPRSRSAASPRARG